MADDDRLGRQPADDPGVVLDDVLDAFPGDSLGLPPGLLDGVGGARPARCYRGVTRLLEQVHPRAPRRCVQPEAVNEDNRCARWLHFPGPLVERSGAVSIEDSCQ